MSYERFEEVYVEALVKNGHCGQVQTGQSNFNLNRLWKSEQCILFTYK